MVAQNGQSSAGHTEAPPRLNEDYNVPDLPILSPNGKKFVAIYLSSRFNLEASAKAANLPLEKAHLYTTDPGIHAHIEAHFRFMHLTVKCLAADARQTVIEELKKKLAACDDPEERDKLLARLQRASAASLIPAGSTRSGTPNYDESGSRRTHPSSQDPKSEIQDPKSEDLPRPSVTFHPTDSPKDTACTFFRALHHQDHPNPDSHLATVAQVLEFDAEIDGDPVECDDPADTIQALADSTLANLRNIIKARHAESRQPSDSMATEVWNVQTKTGFTKVTFEFTKAPPTDCLSRDPGRWLLRKLTTAPGQPLPPDKPPARESG